MKILESSEWNSLNSIVEIFWENLIRTQKMKMMRTRISSPIKKIEILRTYLKGM